MPQLSLLRKVFKEGLESVSKEDLAKLFASRKGNLQKLYRVDQSAEELMERGFNAEYAKKPPLIDPDLEESLVRIAGGPNEAKQMLREGLSPEVEYELMSKYHPIGETPKPGTEAFEQQRKLLYDEPGLYWSSHLQDLEYALPPYQGGAGSKGTPPPIDRTKLIRGIMNPDASSQYYFGRPKDPNYYNSKDFVELSGHVAGNQEATHYIQKKEGNVLAKLGDKYKILGLGAALGLGSQLGDPEEAEAGLFKDVAMRGIGKLVKTSAKRSEELLGKEVTSAAKVLSGKVIDGKVVKTVRKSGDQWRTLVYEDGTERHLKKEAVHHLCREVGTKAYGEMLEGKDAPEQLMQAVKSLDYHSKRQKDFTTKAMKDDYRKIHEAKVKALGLDPVPWTYIQEPFQGYIPSQYVDILEKAGMIKVKKGKK